MSCSKIFLGDLPELTYEIIKYFQNDHSTLYSCILVNRLWCRLAIPLLWDNPFSICTGNYDFIEIYLYNNLNNDFITKLNEYKIINNSLSSKNMLFDYLKFLKYLNIHKFMYFVEIWLDIAIRNLKPENIYNSEQNFRRSVHISLFKIFINEVNLHTLEIEISGTHYKAYLNNILELILQNQNFIQNVRNLKLYIKGYNDNTIINNHILQVIHSHRNLKKILIDTSDHLSLYQSLLLSKNYNCSNTLNTIVFYNVKFKLITNLDKVFEQLNVLESVHIVYCSFLNSIQQIINSTKPFKLKSLILNEVLHIRTLEPLQQLLQKSGDYLENFGGNEMYCSYDISQFLNYCNNINFLYFIGFENKISTYQKINLIENTKQSLNYLSICIWESKYSSNCSSIILKNLGQILPSKLDYLSLYLIIKESDFRMFLENSQYSFINKLLILQCGYDDILHYIKDYYIMKKKRVRYLAIKDDKKELFDLKDEVRELELHNIKVRRHSDLDISIYDFMKNID